MKKLLFLFYFYPFLIINAQLQQDSIETFNILNNNNLNSIFDKQLNAYYLNSIFKYSLKGNISFLVDENYKSNFIDQADKSIRDENFLSITTKYNIFSNFAIGFKADNSILSDNRKIEINKSSISNGLLFLNFKPLDKINITPLIGLQNNKQVNEEDNGLVLGFQTDITGLNIVDIIVNSDLKYRNDLIEPRHNILQNYNLGITNKFGNDVTNDVIIRYYENKKDFYYEADSITSALFNIKNNIQSRDEKNYLFQEKMSINNFFDIFQADFNGSIVWRDIYRSLKYKVLERPSASIFDSKINEFRMEFESNLKYYSSVFQSNLRFNYSERDEKNSAINIESINRIFFEDRNNTEINKNNNAERTTLSLNGIYNFSSKNNLSFNISQNKLKYDTPSNDNYDDRDELLSIAGLKYSHLLNPYFEAFTGLEASYNHIIYIFAEKSSNNNINRTIKYNAGGYYKSSAFTSYNNFEVSANYTVYDFEDINPNYRSYSFRQFLGFDSSRIYFNNYSGFLINTYLKLSEQGDLRWKSFSTRPFRYLSELYLEPKLFFAINELYIYPGYRIYNLTTYKYNTDLKKVADTRYISQGPLLSLNFSTRNNLVLSGLVWYEFINISNVPIKKQTTLDLQVKWIF